MTGNAPFQILLFIYSFSLPQFLVVASRFFPSYYGALFLLYSFSSIFSQSLQSKKPVLHLRYPRSNIDGKKILPVKHIDSSFVLITTTNENQVCIQPQTPHMLASAYHSNGLKRSMGECWSWHIHWALCINKYRPIHAHTHKYVHQKQKRERKKEKKREIERGEGERKWGRKREETLSRIRNIEREKLWECNARHQEK